jgi:septation ring formation regulator EzrA
LAKKAIEQAEFLYKNRGASTDTTDNQQQSKLFLENKKLKKELSTLKQDHYELRLTYQTLDATSKDLQKSYDINMEKLQARIGNIQDDFMGLQQAYSALRYEFNESLDLQSSFLGPNLDVIKQKIKEYISS